MKKKKEKLNLLILGGSSLLSFLWCKAIYKKFNIYLSQHQKDISYLNFPVLNVNFDNFKTLASEISKNEIDIVVNTIGLTNVELCEIEIDKAYYLNAKLPGIIAKACQIANAKLIHISTDHFFDNENKRHTEDDEVSLLNIYSKSKYHGEIEVLSNLPTSLICRTNFFGYGPTYKLSFSDWIIKSCLSNKKIVLFNDVFISPLCGKNLALRSLELIKLNCKGIYNLSSDNSITKYAFGILLCKLLGISNSNIKSGSINSRKDLIKRPNSMALSNLKASNALNKDFGKVSKQILDIK